MGNRASCAVANLFMSNLETQLAKEFEPSISYHRRFIDDKFLIWTTGEQSLKTYISRVQNQHPNIKYSFEYSETQLDYIDVTIYLDHERKPRTRWYRKPMDRGLLLHAESFVPQHVKSNMILGQAIRITRLEHNPTNRRDLLNNLRRILVARGYSTKFIKKSFQVAARKRQDTDFFPTRRTPTTHPWSC